MNNDDLFQASCQHFLAQLGGLTVAEMLGPSSLTPHRATVTQVVAEVVISKEGILIGPHWGVIHTTVKGGRFVAAEPSEPDKYPSKTIAGLPDHVRNTACIRYPIIRVDQLRKRHLSNTSQCGDNRFARVSWGGALDMLYEELEHVQKTREPSALLTTSGWQSTRMLHNASRMLTKTTALHGGSVGTGGDYSTGATQMILPRVAGSVEVYEQQTPWPLVLQNNKIIALQGSDLLKNQQTN